MSGTEQKTEWTKDAAARIQSASDKSGNNADFAKQAQSKADQAANAQGQGQGKGQEEKK